jgi:hypothetical protein
VRVIVHDHRTEVPLAKLKASLPHFFLATGKKQAEAKAERLKINGKIATIEARSGGVYAVRWIDWAAPPRGRWRDKGAHCGKIPR